MTKSDTIFAVATPPGRSAVAVIRVSGPKAGIVPGLFSVKCPEAGRFVVRKLWDGQLIIDEALVLFMRGPRSSTGEDVCEIHCHGSVAVVSELIKKLASIETFRAAVAGEFTRRAFINEKMDLLDVEGLSDLIDSETPAQLHQAWSQIDGALRGPVAQWREELVVLSSLLEALIDFSDEDLPGDVESNLRNATSALIDNIAVIVDDNRVGEIVRDGVVVVLVGPANAGKSTILNKFAGRAAAIVSEVAGTTRDIISIRVDIDGIPTTILDTAGLREVTEHVESEGIARAIKAASKADLVLLVADGSVPEWQKEIASLKNNLNHLPMIILNKSDKGIVGKIPVNAVAISAHNPEDIIRLINLISEKIRPMNMASKSAIITRARHRSALIDAHWSLRSALKHNFSDAPELAAEDFRCAAVALGRITGNVDVEEMLNHIFSSFCIGK